MQIHNAVSPNKMPPPFADELKYFGLKSDQPEPTLVDVCSRDIISLQIDHKNERVTQKYHSFKSSDDELMYLISQFNLENLRDD